MEFENNALREENERVNCLYQVMKQEEPSTQGSDDSYYSPKKTFPAHISRDEYNWGTILKMYEKKCAAMQAEIATLKKYGQPKESRLVLPFNVGHEEIYEKSNYGFSKKFIKIARQAVLVAIRKEPDLNCAATSIIEYLRETRSSKNWLCSINKAS